MFKLKKSITSKEIEIILDELNLKGSILSDIRQNNFSSLTLTFHRKVEGKALLYVSFSQPVCMYEIKDKKPGTAKLQRFIQFTRSVVTPSKVIDIAQTKNEREVKFVLKHLDNIIFLYIRLFSASKANAIITDSENIIKEAMFRHPQEGIIKGNRFIPSQAKEDDLFGARERELKHPTLSSQLAAYYEETESSQSILDYNLFILENEFNKELAKRESKINSIRSFVDNLKLDKIIQDTQNIDYTKSSGEEINKIFNSLKDEKRKKEINLLRLNGEEESLTKLKEKYENIRQSGDLESIKQFIAELRKTSQQTKDKKVSNQYVKCSCEGGGTIFVGRSAKENEFLLRNIAKGNDMFLHLRGERGCYVIIKIDKNKSVPLSAILDGAELALFYTKRLGQGELHKTFVKNVKKIKGGKPGAISIMRDDNFFYKSDPDRLKKILSRIE